MLELSDVAREVVRGQTSNRGAAEALAGLPSFAGDPREEMLAQQRNVGPAFTKGWQLDLHDREAVVEILAELSFIDEL
jgi:hypothetical protein